MLGLGWSWRQLSIVELDNVADPVNNDSSTNTDTRSPSVTQLMSYESGQSGLGGPVRKGVFTYLFDELITNVFVEQPLARPVGLQTTTC